MGPEVNELENKLAAFVGLKHAVGCSSGTDALLMALMAFGVGPGDAILTSPFTFIATAEVIVLLGATPIFVDIDPKTYNIDPVKLEKAIIAVKSNDPSIHPLPNEFESLKLKLSARGIVSVDLFGLPADYDAINALARAHGLFVIEDAAQSFGAAYKGNKACALGDVGCTSFFPAKPLGCYGDGGMCFTDNDEIAAVLGSIRVHGKGSQKYDNARIGINGRLDTLQAAILLAKFDIFPEEMRLRQTVADRYTALLDSASVGLPYIPHSQNDLCIWAQYSLLAENEAQRTAYINRLKAAGIPSAIYYPTPLHMQTAFAYLGYMPGTFPISEDIATRIFSLPMHPYLTESDQARIIDTLTGR